MGVNDSVEVDRMNVLTHLHQQEPVDESAPSDDAIQSHKNVRNKSVVSF